MFKKNRNHKCFWVILLIIALMGCSDDPSTEQQQAKDDTEKIRKLVKVGDNVDATDTDGDMPQGPPASENMKAETHPAFTQWGLRSPKLWEKIEQRIIELPSITAASEGFSASRSQEQQSTIEVIVFLSTDVPPRAGMRLLSSKTIDQVARLLVEEISNHTSYPALMDLFESEFQASAGETMTLMFSLSSEPPLRVKIFVEQE